MVNIFLKRRFVNDLLFSEFILILQCLFLLIGIILYPDIFAIFGSQKVTF
jgi:hypothetical protein